MAKNPLKGGPRKINCYIHTYSFGNSDQMWSVRTHLDWSEWLVHNFGAKWQRENVVHIKTEIFAKKAKWWNF